MNKLKTINRDSINIADISNGWGLIFFRKGEEYLYIYMVQNLRKRISLLLNDSIESNFIDMLKSSDSLEYLECRDPLETLVTYKVYSDTHNPIHQTQALAYSEYVYLALNATVYPFVKITDFTEEDWFYIGPFRDRFFLADVVDSLSKILKLPYCETGTIPCDKFEQDICRGWCLNLSTDEESDTSRGLEKLDKLMLDTFVKPSDLVIQILSKERDKYYDNLEFETSSLFDELIDLHKSYQAWLRFLHKTKSLNYSDDRICVKDGLLESAIYNNSRREFPHIHYSYRPNEQLAIDKALVDEAWILYNNYNKKEEDHVQRT